MFVDYAEANTRHFVQLALGLALYDPTASGRLAAETFEQINQRFIDMLERQLPDLPRKALVWRLYFLICTLTTAARQRTRGMMSLSRGECNPESIDEMVHELIGFAAAGFCAPPADADAPGAPPYAAGG